jgi:hypothetical protein
MEKIQFISTIEGLEEIQECRPKPAKHFIPKWFKDIPAHNDMTVKQCPSFPDYFSLGYIVPMWVDSRLTYDDKNNSWFWETSSSLFKYEVHSNKQMIEYVTPNFNGVDGQFIFKANCPWRVITPPGWSVLQLPLFYHFNQEWSVLPGVIDTDIHTEINQQILYHGNGKLIDIKRGDPFVLYVPFKRDSAYLEEEIRYQNESDIKIFNLQDLRFSTKFSPNGQYRKLQRDRDKSD